MFCIGFTTFFFLQILQHTPKTLVPQKILVSDIPHIDRPDTPTQQVNAPPPATTTEKLISNPVMQHRKEMTPMTAPAIAPGEVPDSV